MSLVVNAFRMTPPAALNVLCPETYSGNAGVTTCGSWKGVHSAAGTGPRHEGTSSGPGRRTGWR